MKKIVLIRHARVDINNSTTFYAYELQEWIKQYNKANIDTQNRPSQKLIGMAKNADFILSSNLKRAIDSALVLGVKPMEKNEIFNELPIPNIKVPLLKFKPKTWLIIFRIAMLLSIKRENKSLTSAKNQASIAAQYLNNLSKKHNNIILIGHGGMHWLTQKALQEKGWEIEGKSSYKNWGTVKLKLLTQAR